MSRCSSGLAVVNVSCATFLLTIFARDLWFSFRRGNSIKILEVLQEPDNHHVSAEDLYKRLIDMGEEIGLATVYRVLNQFDDAGIVTRHNFEGGKSVFELTQQHHHDHLICLDCGKVIEFSDDSIEARQREIAAKHGIRLTNHSLYLYGHCAEGDCREDEHAHEGK